MGQVTNVEPHHRHWDEILKEIILAAVVIDQMAFIRNSFLIN